MALDMSNATYGRSQAGKQALIQAFETDINNLVKVINGDKYATLIKVIRENWVGADADDFIKDIGREREGIALNISILKSSFKIVADNDEKQFAQFQAKNIK